MAFKVEEALRAERRGADINFYTQTTEDGKTAVLSRYRMEKETCLRPVMGAFFVCEDPCEAVACAGILDDDRAWFQYLFRGQEFYDELVAGLRKNNVTKYPVFKSERPDLVS